MKTEPQPSCMKEPANQQLQLGVLTRDSGHHV